jgi:deoxyxylulose-5-phosphate synthase
MKHQSYFDYFLQTKSTHFTSALSMIDYIGCILETVIDYKKDNLVIGKTFGQDAYTYYVKDFFDYVKFSDLSLCNSFGVALGLSYKSKTKTWLNISDSQVESGIFYEFLQNFDKNHNLLVTVDYNDIQLRNRVSDFLPNFKEALEKLSKVPVHFCNGHDKEVIKQVLLKIEFPSIVVFETIKGHGIKELEDNPILYHAKVLNEELYSKLFRES